MVSRYVDFQRPSTALIATGIGLSTFGGTLATIYYFKPQTVVVSTVFLAVVSYVLGELMSIIIPRKGIFRFLNPHPVNPPSP
jgi:hypothetical protein